MPCAAARVAPGSEGVCLPSPLVYGGVHTTVNEWSLTRHLARSVLPSCPERPARGTRWCSLPVQWRWKRHPHAAFGARSARALGRRGSGFAGRLPPRHGGIPAEGSGALRGVQAPGMSSSTPAGFYLVVRRCVVFVVCKLKIRKSHGKQVRTGAPNNFFVSFLFQTTGVLCRSPSGKLICKSRPGLRFPFLPANTLSVTTSAPKATRLRGLCRIPLSYGLR